MTSARQLEVNRQNAQASTGPKSADGKARSSRNALRHGAVSTLPVLPGLERPEDWEAHQDGILRSLAPVGTLEQALAERVALSLWRLQRVAAYEVAVTAAGLDEVAEEIREPSFGRPTSGAVKLEKALKELEERREVTANWEGAFHLLEQLPELPDDAPVDGGDVEGALSDINGELPNAEDEYFDTEDPDFLARLGVPEGASGNAWVWDGWTAGMVRQAVAEMAEASGTTSEAVLPAAIEGRRQVQEEGHAKARQLEGQVRALRRQIRDEEERMRQRRRLPSGDTLDKVARYEAHLSRQLYQALHELQRLQAARGGEPIPPPAALDVTLEASGAAAVDGGTAGGA